MGHGGTEKYGFTRQNAVRIFNALFHKLTHYQGVCAFIDNLFFKLRAFKVNFFNVLAFKNKLFLVFKADGALADALPLKLGLNLHYLEIAQVWRSVIYSFFIGVGKS